MLQQTQQMDILLSTQTLMDEPILQFDQTLSSITLLGDIILQLDMLHSIVLDDLIQPTEYILSIAISPV